MGINFRLVWLTHWTKRVRSHVPAVLVVHAERRINSVYIYKLRAKVGAVDGTAHGDVVWLSHYGN